MKKSTLAKVKVQKATVKAPKASVKGAKKHVAKKAVKAAAKRTELVCILDRSGSMENMVSDTIGGFNGMLAKQKREPGVCHVSTLLFDDVVEVLHDRVEIGKVAPITEKEYTIGGCTAYYDALGRAISHHVQVQRTAAPEEKADKVVFVVITDGLENASREYSGAKIRAMITHEQEKYGWEFVFLGANIDAIQAAEDIGIKAEHAVNFVGDGAGMSLNFACVSEAVSNVRAGRALGAPGAAGGNWRSKADEDFKKRGGGK